MTMSMTIGDVARASGIHVETIRFYQRRGLVPTPRKPKGGVRRYGAAELSRLRFIRRAKDIGLLDRCQNRGSNGCPILRALEDE